MPNCFRPRSPEKKGSVKCALKCTENLYLQTVLHDMPNIENTISVSTMLCLRKEQQSQSPVTCHIWTGKRSKSLHLLALALF